MMEVWGLGWSWPPFMWINFPRATWHLPISEKHGFPIFNSIEDA